MSSPPQHPGQPRWKSFAEWNKTVAPSCLTMEEKEEDLLKRFGLQDESSAQDAWGEVDSSQSQGWGAPIMETNNYNSKFDYDSNSSQYQNHNRRSGQTRRKQPTQQPIYGYGNGW